MAVQTKLTWWMIFQISCGLNFAAFAQDIDAGKSEFLASCATCHGADAKGNGPMSGQLKVPPADLTVLAKKNHGFLPVKEVYEIIDGRSALMSHGTREMPIWGKQFTEEAVRDQLNPEALSKVDSTFDPESVVRTRILSIIDYLNRIQVQK